MYTQQPECSVSWGGICWLLYTLVCSLARKLNGLAFFFSLSRSLARSVSLIAQRICSFLFQPISVRCCRRRSFANVRLDYRGVRRSKQTNREGERERERKKNTAFSLFSLALARASSLSFSHFLQIQHTKRADIVSFSLARAYIQASTTTTIEFYVFPFVSLLSFLFAWSSSNNMRFTYYHRSCSWCCYHYSTNNVIYIFLTIYNNIRLYTLFSPFDFLIVSNRRFTYIYIQNLGLCCFVVVVISST